MLFVIPEFTDIFVPVGRGVGALSVLFVIPEFTKIFALTGKGEGALSVVFSIPEFTDIFVPTGSGAEAKTIMPGVLVITTGALGQTPRLSRTEQQHSKSETQKCGQGSHRGSLTGNGRNGESVRERV